MGALLFTGCVAIAACGDSGGDDGGDDGDGDDGSSSSSFTCCLNGSFYECASAEDLQGCNLNDGPGNCSRDSSKDDTCNN